MHHPHPPTRTAALAMLALVLTACAGLRQPTPAPTATPVAPFAVRPMPSATPTAAPLPSATPLPRDLALATFAALIQTLTPAAPPGPPPAATAAALPATVSCEIPKTADTYTLAPAAEAPEQARTAWADQNAPALTAELREYDAEGRRYTLRAVDPAADYGFILTHTGDPLPIEPGRTYRFTVHQDVAGMPPDGSGLKVEDEAGLVFLGISLRETEGAERHVLAQDRGGITVRQLPTTCTRTETSACGYELRAAPIEARRGDQVLALNAGETGVIATDPPYQVRAQTSHFRRWLGDLPCDDPTDWVLAYRILRAAPPEPTAQP